MTQKPSPEENPYGEYVPGQYSQPAESADPSAAAGGSDYAAAGSTAPSSSSSLDSSASPSYPESSYSSPSYAGSDYSSPSYADPSYSSPSYPAADPYAAPLAYAGAAPLPKGLAVSSLVLGILAFLTGFIVLGFLFAIAGLILGFLALGRVRKGTASGKGMAIAGLILSGLGLIGSIVSAVFFSWLFSVGFECSTTYSTQSQIDSCIEQKLGMSQVSYSEDVSSSEDSSSYDS